MTILKRTVFVQRKNGRLSPVGFNAVIDDAQGSMLEVGATPFTVADDAGNTFDASDDMARVDEIREFDPVSSTALTHDGDVQLHQFDFGVKA